MFPEETRTTLWMEENEGAGDFTPLDVTVGEVGVLYSVLRDDHRREVTKGKSYRAQVFFARNRPGF